MPTLADLPGVPPEQAVAELEVKGSGAERQQGGPLAAVDSDVAENLADRGGLVQVMFPLHEEVKSLPLSGSDEPHADLFKEPVLRREPWNGVIAIAVGHPPSQSEPHSVRQQFPFILLTSRCLIVRVSTALVCPCACGESSLTEASSFEKSTLRQRL